MFKNRNFLLFWLEIFEDVSLFKQRSWNSIFKVYGTGKSYCSISHCARPQNDYYRPQLDERGGSKFKISLNLPGISNILITQKFTLFSDFWHFLFWNHALQNLWAYSAVIIKVDQKNKSDLANPNTLMMSNLAGIFLEHISEVSCEIPVHCCIIGSFPFKTAVNHPKSVFRGV